MVWKVILPTDKKSEVLGKWTLNWDGPYVIEKVFSENPYAIQEVNMNSYIGSINGKYLKAYRPMITEINIPIMWKFRVQLVQEIRWIVKHKKRS